MLIQPRKSLFRQGSKNRFHLPIVPYGKSYNPRIESGSEENHTKKKTKSYNHLYLHIFYSDPGEKLCTRFLLADLKVPFPTRERLIFSLFWIYPLKTHAF